MKINFTHDLALVNGLKIPPKLLGQLNEFKIEKSNHFNLKQSITKDGYIFVRNLFDKNKIKLAREEVFMRLKEVDEIEDPYQDGIYSGRSSRDKIYTNRGEFWKSVSNGKYLREITNGKVLKKIISDIFGEPSIGFDFLFLRPVANGKFTQMHCDTSFFTRTTKKVLTCWISFTNVTIDKGPLFVIENSHKFNDIKEKFDGFDVGIDKNRKASIEEHPSEFAKKRNSKILTSNFYPGDILIFGMNLIHGSFEHHSKDKNIRLTCDVRYQPIAEPKDSRYFGKNPGGTTGSGYGELNSARPLNENWHIR